VEAGRKQAARLMRDVRHVAPRRLHEGVGKDAARVALGVGAATLESRGFGPVDEPLSTVRTRNLLAGSGIEQQLIVNEHSELVPRPHLLAARQTAIK
jgi:hypothetical protein